MWNQQHHYSSLHANLRHSSHEFVFLFFFYDFFFFHFKAAAFWLGNPCKSKLDWKKLSKQNKLVKMDDWDLEVSPRAKTYSPDKRIEFCVNFIGQGTDDNNKKNLAKWLCELAVSKEMILPKYAHHSLVLWAGVFTPRAQHSNSLDPFIPFDSVLSGRDVSATVSCTPTQTFYVGSAPKPRRNPSLSAPFICRLNSLLSWVFQSTFTSSTSTGSRPELIRSGVVNVLGVINLRNTKAQTSCHKGTRWRDQQGLRAILKSWGIPEIDREREIIALQNTFLALLDRLFHVTAPGGTPCSQVFT